MLGLYYIAIPTIAHELALSIPSVECGLSVLAQAGFVGYDTDSETVFIREMASSQIAEQLSPDDKRVKCIRRELDRYKDSPFHAEFLDRYATAFHLKTPQEVHGPKTKTLQRGIDGASDGIPSPSEGNGGSIIQKQEQKQSQKQKQDQNQDEKNLCHANAPFSTADQGSDCHDDSHIGNQRQPSAAIPVTPRTSTSLPSLPLNDRTEYMVAQTDLDEWASLYPAVDVIQELRKMRGWLSAELRRRKTRRGIRKFIVGWLCRAQDQAIGKETKTNNKPNNGRLGSSDQSEYGEGADVIFDNRRA